MNDRPGVTRLICTAGMAVWLAAMSASAIAAAPGNAAPEKPVAGSHPASASAQPEAELLEPEQAFRVSARWQDKQNILVEVDVADSYYMYRDKFRFTTDAAAARLGKPVFPKGQIKRDPFFGHVETYRKSITIKLPVSNPPTDGKLALTIVSQGCADAGVCYPPMTTVRNLTLSPAKPSDRPLSSLLKP